jgi:hypothetical protein
MDNPDTWLSERLNALVPEGVQIERSGPDERLRQDKLITALLRPLLEEALADAEYAGRTGELRKCGPSRHGEVRPTAERTTT